MTLLFDTRRVSDSSLRDYIRGAASIFNLTGNTKREYNLAPTADEADARAIANDWAAVSGDLNDAIETYRKNVG
ncbi:hypothetical protein [Humibacter ginsenosidimutans]|uniref:Uncharacterized protein n=1 Tax=Humibacter ginsenosidimutans TaxID=2599293 RepID=A0A5B8M7X8_9MICO|nr:hypothetical protein [Humibacter ginsenosidimutans]QDZ15765.1 hypothetical protein FPZ11_14245 [Humibacter ginsenosidimutans]